MYTQFANYLIALRGYSPRTAHGYIKDIEHFRQWLYKHKLHADLFRVTRDDLDDYVTDRCAQGIAPATTNHELSSISAYYRFLRREGQISDNPTRYESRRKPEIKVPNTIPMEDIKQAYAHAGGTAKIVLGLLITTGMRICELMALQWRDINFRTGSILLTGKGSKQRVVYTSSEVLALLEQAADRWTLPDYVINIPERRVRQIVHDCLRPYSQARQLSPHAIRHTFATQMALAGVNTSTLSVMLGHQSLETTQRYIDLAQSDTEIAFKQFNPLNI